MFHPLSTRRRTKKNEKKTSCNFVPFVDKILRGLSWMLFLAIAATIVGCSSGPKIPPGQSAAEISVKAEPKKGYHPPAAGSPEYGGVGDQIKTASPTGPLTVIDYAGLYGIVVWLEPTTGTVPAAAPKILSAQSPGTRGADEANILFGAIGDQLVIYNRSPKLDTFYLRLDDGTVANIGSIGGNNKALYTLRHPGLAAIVSDTNDKVIDRVFVASSPLYKVAHCNQTVTFNPAPPGEYRLKSWHYRLPGTSTMLTLAPNKVAKSTVVIGVNSLPKVP